MVRYNNLRIFILANEAKPGGNIGAMLSPYLFSTNMSDFCKKFNEGSKEYELGVFLTAKLFCDIVDRTYTFFITPPNLPLIYADFAKSAFQLWRKKLSICLVFDLVRYASHSYNLNLYQSALIVLGLVRSFRKRRVKLLLSDIFEVILRKFL